MRKEKDNIFRRVLDGMIYGRKVFGGFSHSVEGVNLIEPKLQTKNRFVIFKRMLIKRQKERKLYYISTDPNLSGETISPSVPNSFLNIGSQKIPRVELYENVSDAISGRFLGQKLDTPKKLYLYEVSGFVSDHLLDPTLSQAPYILNLREFWYTLPVRLAYIGEINVEGLDYEETFHYGPRSTVGKIYRWKWKECLKPWQRSKL